MLDALGSAQSGITSALNLFNTSADNIAQSTVDDANQAAAAFSGQPVPASKGSNGIDLAEQMVNMTVARTALKANVNVANASTDVFNSLLQLNAKYKS